MPDPLLNTEWHDYPCEQFADLFNSTYDDIIHWRKNLFKLPNGRASGLFSNELSFWLDHYNRVTAFKCVALKVFMTLPYFLLQKTSRNSKTKDHVKKLEERLKLLNEGNSEETIQEARSIQNRFRNSTISRRTHEDSARSFAKLMWEGKVSAALKMLSKDYDNGMLKLDKKLLEELKLKHSASAKVKEDSLLHGLINNVPNSYFSDIDEITVGRVASLTKGSGNFVIYIFTIYLPSVTIYTGNRF